MERFENNIHVDFKDTFSLLNIERLKCIFRQEMYDYLLMREEENDYYDLDMFCIKYLNRDYDKLKIVTGSVIKEIEDVLGWNIKLSYNDTALFVYSTVDPPSSCW